MLKHNQQDPTRAKPSHFKGWLKSSHFCTFLERDLSQVESLKKVTTFQSLTRVITTLKTRHKEINV